MKIKKIVIICICGMGLVGLTVIYNMNKTRNNELPSVINSNTQTESCIWIDVKGAVRYPNIYCLPQGSIVEDAISIAGGITTGANMSSVNRVAKINEEMILNIPY
jgi:competence protein ComEA